jgi:hypothetical protein
MSSTKSNIEFLLSDTRNCRSRNMIRFFSVPRNHSYAEVIRFDGDLWFAMLGWRTGVDKDGNRKDNGFAGVRVVTVACYGLKAKTVYPGWQKGDDYEIVTDWFWQTYREQGIIGFPEIWHIKPAPQRTHKELHTT